MLEFEPLQLCTQGEHQEAAQSGTLPRMYEHVTLRFPRFIHSPRREAHGIVQGPIHGLSMSPHPDPYSEEEGTLGRGDRRA
jgi:hypothetical protein